MTEILEIPMNLNTSLDTNLDTNQDVSIENENNNDNNILINKTKCMASKSIKELGIRCPLKPKEGSIFCGRHRNTKPNFTFDKILNIKHNLKNNKDEICSSSKVNNNHDITNNIAPHNIIISLQQFQDNPELKLYSKKSIRVSYHYYRLDYYKEIKEKNVDIMLIQLQKFFKRVLYYSIPENEKKLIFLQKIIKKNISRIVNYYRGPAWDEICKCNNETDFFNFDRLEDIPSRYRMTYSDNDNFIYGFHIYSLKELLNRGEKNPYTLKELPKELNNKVETYIKIISKWYKLDEINDKYYSNSKNKGKNKTRINNNKKSIDNNALSGNIIEKAKEELNKLPIKQLSQIQCSQTFSIMTELGYQVNINWLYGKSIAQLSRFIRSLENIYYGYNFHHDELTPDELVNAPLLYFINDINNRNLGTTNKFKVLQRVLNVLNYMFNTLGIGDCKNTISIIIIQALSILEPNDVRNNNPWLM